MKLFKIGNDFQVELNKEWILMVPEFAELLKRDKGSEGDYRGDKKLKARRELTFIYFDLDFSSPLREWDEFERREESMRYAGLKESNLDEAVMNAHRTYARLLENSSRSLRTYHAVIKSLDQLDNYFKTVDFVERDKKGEMVHDPKGYLSNLKTLDSAYDSVDKFRKRVEDELTDGGGIRGKASLGGKEGKREKGWAEEKPNEMVIESTERAPVTNFKDLAEMLSSIGDDKEEED